MNDARISVQVHRYRGYVAVYVGNGETVYLPPSAAKTLGEALIACANEIDTVPNFSQSTIGSKEWTFNGKR